MGTVTFPFCVKSNGVYYLPGAPVEVEDVEGAVAQGATVITDEPPRRGRPKKTED